VTVLAAAAALPGPASAAELPLGPRTLDERRTTVDVAPGVSWTRIVRGGSRQRPGPWRVHVLRVAPGTPAGALLANGVVAGRERPSVFGRGLTAGVNGGYFVASGPGDGDVVGAHVSGGQLVSEPVDGRSALLVPADPLARPRVTPLSFRGSVTIGGATRMLDGVNRVRGVIPGCGGRGGDRPTQRPVHALTCTDDSELVQLTPRFGARTPAVAGGVELTVRRGAVAGAPRDGRGGTPIPADGYVLSGSGDAAAFLRAAEPATDTAVSTTLRTAAGAPLLLADLSGAVSGGPRLLDGGRIAVRSAAEGFTAPGLYARFVLGANPRTLAGVTATGDLLLVTVDGRRPGFSAGVSLLDAARVMRALGARDALNLDGGGSTAMVVRGRTVNRPSDPGGERAVGDGVFAGPLVGAGR
jgi:hypothetical protein